ncbi:hypothetical protein Tco_0734998 [Tanacetum coccineum]
MSTLKFTETHNLVVFLSKPEESTGFEEIVDFLDSSHIKYALTVNPTVYESCIVQFWATAKAKTVNEERQLQALVDKKKVIITETSVRSDLKLEDAEEPITDEATNEEHVSTPSYNPPQSGEDRLQLTELMNLYTSLQKKVLDLEDAKTAQAKEIASLKKRVKQLEKRRKSRTPGLTRLRKVGSARRVESSDDASLGAQETQGRNDEDLMFDTSVPNGDEVFEEPMVIAAITTSSIPVSADDPVTTAGEKSKQLNPKTITTAATTTTTTRPKARGVVVQEPSEFTTTTSPSQASQLPQAKDKGKTKMVELEKPLKKKDQLHLMKKLLEILKLNYKLNWKKKRGLQDKRKKKPT